MTHDDSLRTPYRSVRPVDAMAGGPWPGMLTCLPSGERRVFVDAATFAPGWAGWDAAPAGHILAAHDVVRRADGHDVVIEVCAEQLATFLARREASGAPLSTGEAITIGVSLLRGCAELSGALDTAGEWWLTEGGRPVFAATDAGPTLRAATIGLLEGFAPGTGRSPAWGDAAAVLAMERVLAAEIEQAEHALFEVAQPVALVTAGGVRSAHGTRTVRSRSEPAVLEDRPTLWGSLARHVDADFADAVSRVTTALWRRGRRDPARRRAPLIVGAVSAAAVLAIGLAWPGGGVATAESPLPERSTATHDAVPSTGPSGAGAAPDRDAVSPTTGPASSSDPSGEEDLAGVAATLLDALRACDGDEGCRAALWMGDVVAPGPGGVIELPADQRTVVLLDDFGGVAVLRADAIGGAARDEPAQLVVIARNDQKWLLRDVHDVAQQP